MAAPTSIGIDTPLPGAPAKGATIISLTDGSDYSGVFETSLAEAGKTAADALLSVAKAKAESAKPGIEAVKALISALS